jgi:hypothetical protein
MPVEICLPVKEGESPAGRGPAGGHVTLVLYKPGQARQGRTQHQDRVKNLKRIER